jgi:hypothetical protein
MSCSKCCVQMLCLFIFDNLYWDKIFIYRQASVISSTPRQSVAAANERNSLAASLAAVSAFCVLLGTVSRCAVVCDFGRTLR